MPLISIIVPVYKVEKYLRRCIDSILLQSFTDFEVLLIDDGSPDKSGEICDEYLNLDSRVRVLHKNNGGVTSARKAGIDIARGIWITFVDSDDTIPDNALYSYYAEVNSEYDIIIGRIDHKNYPYDFLDVETYRSISITGKIVHCGPFGKMFRKDLFDDFILDIPREIVKGEDMLMNIRIAFKNNKRVRLISKCVYNYIYNETSCIQNFKNTIEYEVLYNNYRILSIPKEERKLYEKECLNSFFNGIDYIITQDRKNDCIKHPYCISLLKKVETRRLGIILRYKLCASNTLILQVILLIEKFINKIGLIIKNN